MWELWGAALIGFLLFYSRCITGAFCQCCPIVYSRLKSEKFKYHLISNNFIELQCM